MQHHSTDWLCTIICVSAMWCQLMFLCVEQWNRWKIVSLWALFIHGEIWRWIFTQIYGAKYFIWKKVVVAINQKIVAHKICGRCYSAWQWCFHGVFHQGWLTKMKVVHIIIVVQMYLRLVEGIVGSQAIYQQIDWLLFPSVFKRINEN